MKNKDKCKPMQPSMMCQTRVLHVIGPNGTLNATRLERMLHTSITFDLVERREWEEDRGLKCVELTFCSIEGHSRQAKKCVKENMKQIGEYTNCRIRYGPDPCDPTSGELWNGVPYSGARV